MVRKDSRAKNREHFCLSVFQADPTFQLLTLLENLRFIFVLSAAITKMLLGSPPAESEANRCLPCFPPAGDVQTGMRYFWSLVSVLMTQNYWKTSSSVIPFQYQLKTNSGTWKVTLWGHVQ